METYSLVYDISFLSIAIYLVLYFKGVFKVKDPDRQSKMEQFRQSMNPWGLYFSIVILVLFSASLIIRLVQFFNA